MVKNAIETETEKAIQHMKREIHGNIAAFGISYSTK
jgi:hypothetical protein